ncbi:hypothetical protein C0992_001870 [Termitomyces sp. T32_za158]|nr:hypothetical protein C0992_001870 [Termitomyces sp. T32_za158]
MTEATSMPAILSARPARTTLLPAPTDVPVRTNTKPRRTKPYSHSHSHSHSKRPRAPLPLPRAPHPFDSLPWLPLLDATPSDRDVWDLADLSQLPDKPPVLIARRPFPDLVQTAPLRPSTPQPPPPSTPTPLPTPLSLPLPLPLPLPPCDTRCPTTPRARARFVPARVLFHNLMPVLCDASDSAAACTSS